MTPPALDSASVHAKLALLRRLLDDLDETGEVTRSRLEGDQLLRYAIERILTQLVDLAVAINGHLVAARLGAGPPDYRASFAMAVDAGVLPADLADRLAPSVGLRNVLTHEYVTVDLDIVVAGVALARTGYREYVRAVAQALLD